MKPPFPHNKHEKLKQEATTASKLPSDGSTIAQRKINSMYDIKNIMSRALGLKKSKPHAILQSQITDKLAKIRENLQQPLKLLNDYPEMANNPIIYGLAREEESQKAIKELCKARLEALRKHFSRYPVLKFLQETARWAARKVAILFSKNINLSVSQEIKALEESLEHFEQDSAMWLKRLEKFEHEKDLISLADTLSAHLYFSPDKAKALQPLSIHPKSDLSLPEQDKLRLEQSRLNWLSLKLRKKKNNQVFKKLLPQQIEAQPKTADTIEALSATTLPKLFIDTDTDTQQQMRRWQQECNTQGLSRLAYININQNGLIGRLFEENQALAEKILETRLNNLRKDITLTFSDWLTRRRNQASAALDQLTQNLEQLKSTQLNPSHLKNFLDELQQYEEEFDKKPFTLMFNMAFLQKAGDSTAIDFLEVTRAERQRPTTINLSVMDSHHILIKSLSTEGIKEKLPVITSGKALDIQALLKDNLENNPEKVQALAIRFIQPTTSENDSAILIAPLDSKERKEQFYAVLENPEHQTILSGIQKALLEDCLLEQLASLEPKLITDMIRSELNNQLAMQHHAQHVKTLKHLQLLPADAPDTAQKMLAFIRKQENSCLISNLQQAVNHYYFAALRDYINDVHQNVTAHSQNEVLKALSACDTLQLFSSETPKDQQRVDDETAILPDQKQLSKQKQLLEAELAWRLTKSEQFTPVKERTYILACPSREDFIALATREDISSSTSSSWLRWIMSPYSDQEHHKKDADIIKQITHNYIPALRKFYTVPYHTNLHRLQQQRFRLLAEQKHYIYSEALRSIENKDDGTLIPENEIEAYKRHLKNIDVIQKTSTPSRPSDSFFNSVQGVIEKVSGTGDYLSLDQMLDDIEWRQDLTELGYNYHDEFLKRTGIPIGTKFEKVSGVLKLGYSKIKSALNIGSSITTTNQQLHEASAPLLTEQEAIKKLLEGFIDKTLNDLNKIRSVARRNPALFRKTFGEVAAILPTIAKQLGFEDLAGNATLLNVQVQKYASEFMGTPEESIRKERQVLTDEDREWIKHIQFVHDSAVHFMNLQHKFTIAKNVAATSGRLAAMAGSIAVLGPAAGFTVMGIGSSLSSFLSGTSTAISPAASKAVIDSMSLQSLAFAHNFATGSPSSSIDLNTLARTAGYAAAQAPHMTTDKNSLNRLYHASKVVMFHMMKPVSALKSQFNVIKKSFYEARAGKIDGWHIFAREVLPVAAIFLGSTAAAVCAGVSVFLTFGASVGIFAAALGAFAFASTNLSSALLYQNITDRVAGNAINMFREQLFRPESNLAKKVRSLCTQQAQKLFSGHLIKAEAFRFLEQQTVLRSYYQKYWQQYCQQQLKKSNISQKEMQQLEQQHDIEFSNWLKKIKINYTAKEISQKVQALHHIDAFLKTSQTPNQQNFLETSLQELNIISVLPSDETAHFVRMLRDEISEYIHLECGEIPDTTMPEKIKEQLTQRCKEAFLGNKVRKAVTAAGHPELDNFESTTKKHFQESQCKRIAIRAENHIKALIKEPVKPLPTPSVQRDVTANSYDHVAFEETVDKILADSGPVAEGEDEDIFFDAQEELVPQSPEEPTDPEEFEESFFTASADFSAPDTATGHSYDHLRTKLNDGSYLHEQGASELAKDISQLTSAEDYIKASMQTPEEAHAIQEILGCSDDNMKELKDYVFQMNFRGYSIKVRVALPHFIRRLLTINIDQP